MDKKRGARMLLRAFSIFVPTVVLACTILLPNWASAASTITVRLDDPQAVYLTGAKGDGKADDSAAIQAAIDKAAGTRRQGIVFMPSGR